MSGENEVGDKTAGDFVALRTLAWHRGTVGKGLPVPADVPQAVLREWDARGWLAPAERHTDDPASQARRPASGKAKR